MKTALRTDIGRIRTVNEDRALAVPDLNGFTFAVVADGMGGHQAGDTASQMAVEILHNRLHELRPGMSMPECRSLLEDAVKEANRRVYEVSVSREQFNGMGTTLVGMLAVQDQLLVANIGDSRAYLCRRGQIIQLTEDHTLVNELVKSGQITKEQAEQHPRRNWITRSLGTDPEVEADISFHRLEPGDVVLACSDGLSGLVPVDRMCAVLLSAEDLEQRADALIHMALEAGGDDNITVVLLENETDAKG